MKTLVLTAVAALFALGCAQKKANTHTSYQKTEQMTENQQMDNEVMDEEEPQSKTYIYFECKAKKYFLSLQKIK